MEELFCVLSWVARALHLSGQAGHVPVTPAKNGARVEIMSNLGKSRTWI